MITITMTVTNRPEYLRQSLERINMNDLSDTRIYFAVEPIAGQEVRQILETFHHPDKKIILNPRPFGDQVNPHSIVGRAFSEGSTFNVHFDEDLVISPDAFNLLRWYQRQYQSEPLKYMHYSLFNYYSDPSRMDEVVTINDFWGLGWGIFRENWDNIFNKYWFDNAYGGGWDWRFPSVMTKHGYKSLMPACSRLNHIGLHGMNNTPGWQEMAFTHLKWNTNGVYTDFRLTGEIQSRRMKGEPLV